MNTIPLWLDPLFILPYRILPTSAWPGAAFLVGTGILALVAVLLGRLTLRLARRLHRARLTSLSTDMRRYHELSEEALRQGSKDTFKAVNKQAHEAFGYQFSLNGALFAASLWPVPFMLAWMQMRFGAASLELPFALPLLGDKPSFVFWFLLCYIPLRVVWK